MRNQRGFTLIEIIAVLVILGILSAVAVPKFVDMQEKAREYAVQGAAAALKSTAIMDYANKLLTTPSTTTYTLAATTFTVGDFTGTIAATAGAVTVTVTNGPTWWNSSIAGNSSSFTLY